MNKAERRQVLLRAARDVFATKGYHDAKVDDIVALAKVAKGTFYLYFPDKRSVFSELVDVLFVRLGAAILKVDTGRDVDEQIKHNIRAVVAVLLDDPALTRILLSYATGMDPAFVTKMKSFYDGVKALLAASLKEGQSLGIVAEGDPELLATFSVGALKELLAEKVVAEAPMAREDIVDALFRFLQAGYLRTSGPPPSVVATPKPTKRRR
ncbi:Transcriptional regulator, TetR family protein [Minicystis rosea]|nr:Transcriptional regulator, TetR family protein [Minicystis rosea]